LLGGLLPLLQAAEPGQLKAAAGQFGHQRPPEAPITHLETQDRPPGQGTPVPEGSQLHPSLQTPVRRDAQPILRPDRAEEMVQGGGATDTPEAHPDQQEQGRRQRPLTGGQKGAEDLPEKRQGEDLSRQPAAQPERQEGRHEETTRTLGPEAKGWGCRLQLHRFRQKAPAPMTGRGEGCQSWSEIGPALWRLQPMNSRLGAETPAEDVPFR
jgi:hypothetical protein